MFEKLMRLMVVIACVACMSRAVALPLGFEGDWDVPGDAPGSVDATVGIARSGDEFVGAITSFAVAPGEDADPRCVRCPVPQRGRSLRGLQIIWGLRLEAGSLVDGHLLDPVEGKLYRCRLDLADDGRTLRVRLYAGLPLLGITQEWRRHEPAREPAADDPARRAVR